VQGFQQEVSAAVRPLELELIAGPAAGQRLTVAGQFKIGAAEEGHASLGGDPWLSAAHALIHHGPDGWAIEDLRSLEGTRVNGRPVRGACTLATGDSIELGSSRIVMLPGDGTDAQKLHAQSAAGVAKALSAESRRPLDGRRLGAYLLDLAAISPLGLVAHDFGAGRAVFWMGAAALALVYFFLCESLTGQTLGKRVFGLRVVRVDGTPVTPQIVAGRTVLRLIDEFALGPVGMLTMVITGGRRQRLGDLAVKTAVARASVYSPPHVRRAREWAALIAYPCVWLAPAVLLYALFPDARVPACHRVNVTFASGEGSCSLPDGQVYTMADNGHVVRVPGYDVLLVDTAVRRAGSQVRVAGFKLRVTNTGDEPLRFDRQASRTGLLVPRLDGTGIAAVAQIPERVKRYGLKPFARRRPIPPGATRTAWARYALPARALSQLTVAPAHLRFVAVEGSGSEHYGALRLWRSVTPEGARALRPLTR
jgi:uncharacterized RDD family membrane protein YckC